MFVPAVTQVRAIPVPSPAQAALATACLSAGEHRLLEKYRHQGRRAEFVAGRLTVKRALLERQAAAVRIGSAAPLPDPLLPAAQQMQVLPDGDGRPTLWVDDALTPAQLSIAHCAGWVAAACSPLPIGIDIVEIDAPAAIPDDHPWLADADAECRPALRALLWGLRECLLKTGQTAAKTVWSLEGVDAVPTRSAGEIIARWPCLASLAPLEIQVEERVVTGAFVPLSRSALLVMLLVPAPLS